MRKLYIYFPYCTAPIIKTHLPIHSCRVCKNIDPKNVGVVMDCATKNQVSLERIQDMYHDQESSVFRTLF